MGRDPAVSDTAIERKRVSSVEHALAAVRQRIRLDRGEDTVALRVVYAGVAAYAVLFVLAAVMHYLVFEEARFDLGNMVQAIWNTLHGHVLGLTAPSGHQGSRLGSHVDPFLVLLSPVFWIWSSPLLLLVVQVLAVSSGALPVFWLARKHLGSSRAAAHFAFAYLLYPATQFNAFTPGDGFHSVSLAVPLVLFAVWFLDEDRFVAFSAVALLACSTKEEIPLAIGCLGIWYAVRRGHRLFGLSVFGIGLGLTLFNFMWVIPHFSPTGASPFADRYSGVGGTPSGMAHKLYSDPAAFVHAVATGHKAGYLALLLLPSLGLFLLEPLLFLGALPDLAINLLSSNVNQTTLQFQYTAGILPFVVAATIFGAARLMKYRQLDLPLWVLAAAAAVAIYSPIYLGMSDVRGLGSPLVAAKQHAVSLVPESAPVAATNRLGGYLSERRLIYTFPYVGRARWIVADVHDGTYIDVRGFKRVVRRYERSEAWRTVFSSHGIVVLRRQTARLSGHRTAGGGSG
jgi:uncharacterized membrane protein